MIPLYLSNLPDPTDYEPGSAGWIIADQMGTAAFAIKTRLQEIQNLKNTVHKDMFEVMEAGTAENAEAICGVMENSSIILSGKLIETQTLLNMLTEQREQWKSFGEFTKDLSPS